MEKISYLKISAREARKITEESVFIKNIIYKYITSNAKEGKKSFMFTYDREDPALIQDIEQELVELGYIVKKYEDTSSDQDSISSFCGFLDISW